MEKITTEIYIDFDRLKETYEALYQAYDEEFIANLNNSISDSMRSFELEFYENQFILINKEKGEQNTFRYDELHKVIKKNNSYFLFTTQQVFYFVKSDDFSKENLSEIDIWLKPYYEKNLEDEIAKIECYNSKSVKRLMSLTWSSQKKMILIGHFLIFFLLLIIWFDKEGKINGAKDLFVLSCMILVPQLFYFLIVWITLKIQAYLLVKSIKEEFSKVRVVFHKEKIEVIGLRKIGVVFLKYQDFHKIKRKKNGYLFLIQKYTGYYFYFKEIEEQNKGELDAVLEKYYKK